MEQKGKGLPIFTKRFRELQGEMSNTEFAKFLCLSRQTVGFYCNMERVPDVPTLMQIAEKCQVSTDWLLGLSDAKMQDGDLRQVCNYTGLSENAALYLNMDKELNKGTQRCGIRLINGIASDGGHFSDLVWKSALSTFEARRTRESSKQSPGDIAAAMIAYVVSRQPEEFDGMIKIPADDAACLYEDAAAEYIAYMARTVIDEYVEEYVSSVDAVKTDADNTHN